MPSTLALRHVAFEDLGTLAPILQRRGHDITYVEAPLAALAAIDPLEPDLLVVLGGPIGVYETNLYPFLATEIELITKRLRADRPILGLCLGSQLMARALGARVYSTGVKEIGWTPLEFTPEGEASCLRNLFNVSVLHWHGDTFELPEGAVRLASTLVCQNQAFSWGKSALGLQFHVEAAGKSLESWFVGHAAEIAATAGISVPQLREDTERCTPAIVASGSACLTAWLDSQGL